ncbi:MAG: hypothetical protein ABW090_08230 [Sedimenticola sp.]
MVMNRYLVPVALVVVSMTGCGSGFFSSGIDSKHDGHGKVILLDTPNNWDTWITIIDLEIADELAGKKPPGGAKSWDERWYRSIDNLNEGHQENEKKYIKYIIDSRRKVGLPPLKKDN